MEIKARSELNRINSDLNFLDTEIYKNSFINDQGKGSVKNKLDRKLNVNDSVILLKDYSKDLIYRGYFCTIIGIFGYLENEQEFLYEIEFDSCFEENDKSRLSQEYNPSFEFPCSNYNSIVPGSDLLRVETQDLCYRTNFL